MPKSENEFLRAAARIYLGLGSNMGDRESHLREAMGRIEAVGLCIVRASSVYETEPVGYMNQPWFLNQVIEVKAGLEPFSPAAHTADSNSDSALDMNAAFFCEKMLAALLNIEREMGRERTVHDGPRVIDIDLLLCGDLTLDNRTTVTNDSHSMTRLATVIVPHPRMHLRRFVLAPLCEIAPDVIHPKLKKTCRELLAALDDASTVRIHSQSR